MARQKRLTLDGDHFFVDLVLYNRRLRCFVLVDLEFLLDAALSAYHSCEVRMRARGDHGGGGSAWGRAVWSGA